MKKEAMTEKRIKKEITSVRRVRFSDCDSFGHLNNAAYLEYFMDTREEQVLAEYNFSFPETYKKYNAAWVVGETRIVYLLPAKYGVNVNITTRIVQNRRGSVIIEGVMLDEGQNAVHAIGAVNFIWVDLKTGRPKIHPEDVRELLDNVDTGIAADGLGYFTERVKTLKKEVHKKSLNSR